MTLTPKIYIQGTRSDSDYVESDDDKGINDTQEDDRALITMQAMTLCLLIGSLMPKMCSKRKMQPKLCSTRKMQPTSWTILSTTPTPKDVVQNLFRTHVRGDASWNCGNQVNSCLGRNDGVRSEAQCMLHLTGWRRWRWPRRCSYTATAGAARLRPRRPRRRPSVATSTSLVSSVVAASHAAAAASALLRCAFHHRTRWD